MVIFFVIVGLPVYIGAEHIIAVNWGRLGFIKTYLWSSSISYILNHLCWDNLVYTIQPKDLMPVPNKSLEKENLTPVYLKINLHSVRFSDGPVLGPFSCSQSGLFLVHVQKKSSEGIRRNLLCLQDLPVQYDTSWWHHFHATSHKVPWEMHFQAASMTENYLEIQPRSPNNINTLMFCFWVEMTAI